MEESREDGAASIHIDLTNSIISVYHGESNDLLFQYKAHKGDWEKIWSVFRATAKEDMLYEVK